MTECLKAAERRKSTKSERSDTDARGHDQNICRPITIPKYISVQLYIEDQCSIPVVKKQTITRVVD